jgi:hypothetical protein
VVVEGQVSDPQPYKYGNLPPVLSSLEPAGGPTLGGTVLTIRGENFGVAGEVRVGGLMAPIGTWDPTKITCLLPPGNPGPAPVEVITSDGTSPPLAFKYDPPHIDFISPNSGPAAGGTLLTIRGQNFGRGDVPAEVFLGSNPAPGAVVVSQDEMQAFSPPGPPGASFALFVRIGGIPSINATPFTYDATVAVEAPARPLRFALQPNRPNPFHATTTFVLDFPEAAAYELTLHDVAGRLVRRFAGAAPAGSLALRWDGADARGQRLPAGVYLARFTVAGRIDAARRVLLTR